MQRLHTSTSDGLALALPHQRRTTTGTAGSGLARRHASRIVTVASLKIRERSKNPDPSIKSDKGTQRDRVAEPLDSAVSSPTAYSALAVSLALLAGAASIFPHGAAELVFGDAALPHDDLHEPLFRIVATGLTQGALISAALQASSKSDNLNKQPFQRLELGLVVFSTIQVLLQVVNISQPGARVLTTQAFWAAAAVWGVTVAIAWGGFGKNSEGLSVKRAGPLPIVKRFQDDTAGLVEARSPTSIGYSVLAASFFAAGASYLAFPELTLEATFGKVNGGEIVYLWRTAGAALISLVAVSAYSLKEGAQKKRLGEDTYKLLNVGLAAGAGVHLAVLAPYVLNGSAGPLSAVIAATWTAAGAISVNNLRSPEE